MDKVENPMWGAAGLDETLVSVSKRTRNRTKILLSVLKTTKVSRKVVIQSTLGFETLDKAAALGLETATCLTAPCQYINSNLGFSNLKI